MLRIRTTLTVAICVAALLAAAAPAGAALNLDGFPVTFPKAAALCAKADKGKLGAKLKPSRAKVVAACRTLRQNYSDALAARNAKVEPVRRQMKDIVRAQREACLQARRTRDRTACRTAQLDARAKLAPLRAQVADAERVAQAAFDKARKAFWATVRKLRGGAGISPDPAPGQNPVTDVPQDGDLDQS